MISRAPVPAAAVFCAIALASARECCASGLYQSRTIVTGTDLRSRPAGLAECLRMVLVKVSGNPELRAGALTGEAGDMVEDLAYLDRMSDIPLRDEQGSRDRPYELIAHFDPAKIDAMLAGLGEKPWTDRPPVVVVVTIQKGEPFTLSGDGVQDERERRALLAAAERFGLRIMLPVRIEPPRIETEGKPLLTGSLVWSDAALGWIGEWRMGWRGQDYAWGIRGVSFDEAFRNAVAGAAQILSGHGQPAAAGAQQAR
jgi:hypothetical protein